MISLRDIKRFAAEHKHGTTFASLVSREADEITDAEFRAKLPIWFQLLQLEEGAGNVSQARAGSPVLNPHSAEPQVEGGQVNVH